MAVIEEGFRMYTRREFGAYVAAGIPALTFLTNGARSLAQSTTPPNRSLINGVQFGLQPFCYHDLPMTAANSGTLIKRLVQNGLGMVELHATWVEPQFAAPGVSIEEAREKLRQWRLTAPASFYRSIKQEFDDAGIVIFSYYVNLNDSYTDAEIDAVFAGAKILGAQGCVGSQGLRVTGRLAAFPGKHGMFMGVHNHANLSDPDALNNEASFVEGAVVFAAHQGDPRYQALHRRQRRLSGIPCATPCQDVERASRGSQAEQRAQHPVRRGRRANYPGSQDDSGQPVADRRAARVRARDAASKRGRSAVDVRLLQTRARLTQSGAQMSIRHRLSLTVCGLLAAVVSVAAQSGARSGYNEAFIGPPLADPVMQYNKESYVMYGCAYCHGVNLVPRGEAPDLRRSALVGSDVDGSVIVRALRAGFPQTTKLSPMPQVLGPERAAAQCHRLPGFTTHDSATVTRR